MSQEGTNRRRVRAEAFTLGWICALDIEFTAAVAALDEEYENNPDSRQYALGRISGQDVVIACMPTGQMGTANAAALAVELQFKFPSLRALLMVGIGGGVPSLEADIRLGDVVVSVPQGTNSGVVQYDFGKRLEDGKLMRTRPLNSPPWFFLTAVANLRASISAGRSRVSDYLGSIAAVPGFSRNEAGPDLLFPSSYLHRGGIECDDCCKDTAIGRFPRDTDEIKLHCGTIASGNQVIKDARERESLSAELGGVLCFEMEAAGLMNALPSIVVRGICDYADSHKHKKWQRFAAAAAAACGKAILSFVPSVSRENSHQEETQPPIPQLDVDRNSTTLTKEQRKRYLESLRFDEIETRYSTIRAAHTNTCRWLLARPEYREWLDSDQLAENYGMLWIKGNPGTGKSTIMKFISSQMQNNSPEGADCPVIISFFFNARGDVLEKSTLGMYRSLLYQLLEKVPHLRTVVDSIRLTPPSKNESITWDVDTLTWLFRRAVELLRQESVICFIDALDECDEDQVREMALFFEDIGCLAATSGLQFRVCFSSRHYPAIVIDRGLQLILDDLDEHYRDISNYVHSTLKGGLQVAKIKESVIEKSSGIFLWAALVVPILNKEFAGGDMRAMRKRLEEIPKGLNKLFKSIITRDDNNTERLLLCLQWILFAARPLTCGELYFAIMSGNNAEPIRPRDPEETIEVMERYISTTSKGLAEITGPGKALHHPVQFIHESVRDFLLKEGALGDIWTDLQDNLIAKSHERLKQCCLCYIKADGLPFKALITNGYMLTARFPFLEYAVRQVLRHAEAAERGGLTQAVFLRGFPLDSWVQLTNFFEPVDARYTSRMSLLYVLAEYNMANLIRILRAESLRSLYLRHGDLIRESPIVVALGNGNRDALCALLEVEGLKMPTPSEVNRLYERYSRKDVDMGHLMVNHRRLNPTRMLSHIAPLDDGLWFAYFFQRGAWGPNDADFTNRSVLSWAAGWGHDSIVKELLELHGVDPDTPDLAGRTPGEYARENGHASIVHMLDAARQAHLSRPMEKLMKVPFQSKYKFERPPPEHYWSQ